MEPLWRQWGPGIALELCCVMTSSNSLFIRCQEKLDHECWLGIMLDCMLICSILPDFVRLDLIALPTLLDLISCIERDRYWSRHADSEIFYLTAIYQIKVFIRWHIIEIFAIPPRCPLKVYVPVPEC